MSLKFEIFNGETLASGSLLFNASNRAIRYGDGLFETIKVSNGKLCFIGDHLERLVHGLKMLHLDRNSPGKVAEIEDGIVEFIRINEVPNMRIRLIVYRESAGFYAPKEDKVEWNLSGYALETSEFLVYAEGVKAGLYRENFKSKTDFSTVKTLNCLVSVLGGIYARNHGWDDALLLNTSGNIIEATGSNLFIRKGNSFFTPPLSDGCLDGVMRKNVMRLLREHGFVCEEKSLSENDAEGSEEMLLTNAISGVRWIDSYHERKLQNTISGKITQWLNESIS